MYYSQYVLATRARGITPTIDRDNLLTIPEVMIETFDTKPEIELKPYFDAIWNAYELQRAHNYDKNGVWIQL